MGIFVLQVNMGSDWALFRFKRGSHICVFYYDETTLLDFLVPYIAEGLWEQEKCFLVQSPSIVKRLPFALERAGIDYAAAVDRGAIELHSVNDVYLKSGKFDVEGMMAGLENSISAAVKSNFKGLRTAGDLGWASTANLSHDTLVLYEKMVQQTFPLRPAVGVCQFPVQLFAKDQLETLLEHHQVCMQQPQSDSNHSSLTIRDEAYTLDVVADRHKPQSSVYYVLQRRGSADILAFGEETTVESAIRAGKQMMAM